MTRRQDKGPPPPARCGVVGAITLSVVLVESVLATLGGARDELVDIAIIVRVCRTVGARVASERLPEVPFVLAHVLQALQLQLIAQ